MPPTARTAETDRRYGDHEVDDPRADEDGLCPQHDPEPVVVQAQLGVRGPSGAVWGEGVNAAARCTRPVLKVVDETVGAESELGERGGCGADRGSNAFGNLKVRTSQPKETINHE